MNLQDISFVFNRALSLSFSLKKLFIVSIVLAACGLLMVFFQALAFHAGDWVYLSLFFLPFFLSVGVLLSMGIFLIRVYHNEVKGKNIEYKEVLAKSWETIIGASYFSMPMILSYLVFWMALGVFLLLRSIPFIGDFIGVILAFGPFLLNLGSLVLCMLSLATLFLVAPIIALKGINRIVVAETLTKRLKQDPFINGLMGALALLPLILLLALLLLAATMTGNIDYGSENPMFSVVQSFFIMVPFVCLLSPAVIFFFNFAAEAHVILQKRETSSSA